MPPNLSTYDKWKKDWVRAGIRNMDNPDKSWKIPFAAELERRTRQSFIDDAAAQHIIDNKWDYEVDKVASQYDQVNVDKEIWRRVDYYANKHWEEKKRKHDNQVRGLMTALSNGTMGKRKSKRPSKPYAPPINSRKARNARLDKHYPKLRVYM